MSKRQAVTPSASPTGSDSETLDSQSCSDTCDLATPEELYEMLENLCLRVEQLEDRLDRVAPDRTGVAEPATPEPSYPSSRSPSYTSAQSQTKAT